MDLPSLITFFSGISFLGYGAALLFSQHMVDEFIRFGFSRQRRLTGYLQLLGALGLLVGYWYTPLIAFISATGLCLMMFFGFGVRLKIRDTVIASSPALLYALLNLYLAVHYAGLLSPAYTIE